MPLLPKIMAEIALRYSTFSGSKSWRLKDFNYLGWDTKFDIRVRLEK
jgi:hypothetical protein